MKITSFKWLPRTSQHCLGTCSIIGWVIAWTTSAIHYLWSLWFLGLVCYILSFKNSFIRRNHRPKNLDIAMAMVCLQTLKSISFQKHNSQKRHKVVCYVWSSFILLGKQVSITFHRMVISPHTPNNSMALLSNVFEELIDFKVWRINVNNARMSSQQPFQVSWAVSAHSRSSLEGCYIF